MPSNSFTGYQLYFGDLHNHCNQVGYGSVTDALKNARSQLDFATVTANAVWHDENTNDARLADISRYHREGFARAASSWEDLVNLCEQSNTPVNSSPFRASRCIPVHTGIMLFSTGNRVGRFCAKIRRRNCANSLGTTVGRVSRA